MLVGNAYSEYRNRIAWSIIGSEQEGTTMKSSPVFPLQIYYDGSCSVCAREVEQYRRKDRDGRLILVDISADVFDPEPLGIDREQFMRQLHAIDQKGEVFLGVDAFWAIWQAFPSSRLLKMCGALITLPLVNQVARFCYRIFASVRGYLPKRSKSCKTGSCRIGVH